MTKARERNVLFNDALNTFYLRLYGVRHMVKDHSDSEKENPCRHIGYSYRLTARVLLYAPSHRQDNTYHGLCYTSRGNKSENLRTCQEYMQRNGRNIQSIKQKIKINNNNNTETRARTHITNKKSNNKKSQPKKPTPPLPQQQHQQQQNQRKYTSKHIVKHHV